MGKQLYDEMVRTTGTFNAARVALIMGVTMAQVQLWNRQRAAFLRTKGL